MLAVAVVTGAPSSASRSSDAGSRGADMFVRHSVTAGLGALRRSRPNDVAGARGEVEPMSECASKRSVRRERDEVRRRDDGERVDFVDDCV